MDLLELGNGRMISGPTYINRSCNMMMRNNAVAVAAGCGFGVGVGVGQPLDDARSKQQLFDSVSKSPGGRGMTQASMGGFFPFTNAQWKELERQAMVFKYMMHSIPVPYELLFPFISSPSTDPSGMMMMRDTHVLKLLKNGDPEPGRCRRTDGKKWRCANAAAIDQKYCEKHVHRGRPRSRKHVEAAAAAASDLNKIHKKPCLVQAQNQISPCPQIPVSKHNSSSRNGACLNLGRFQLPTVKKPSVADISSQSHLRNGDLSDDQWQQRVQFPHQMNYPNLKKPTSSLIDAWTLNSARNASNAQPDLVSLGLSMGHGSYTNEDVSESETKQDETHDWLGQSGGPLGEVLRPTPLTPSPKTANGASSISCTGVLQEAIASLSDGAKQTISAPSTSPIRSKSGLQWFVQDKLLKQSST